MKTYCNQWENKKKAGWGAHFNRMLQTIVQMQSFLSNEKVIDPKWVGFFGHRVKYPTPPRRAGRQESFSVVFPTSICRFPYNLWRENKYKCMQSFQKWQLTHHAQQIHLKAKMGVPKVLAFIYLHFKSMRVKCRSSTTVLLNFKVGQFNASWLFQLGVTNTA